MECMAHAKRTDGVQHEAVNERLIKGCIRKCESNMNKEINEIMDSNDTIDTLWANSDKNVNAYNIFLKKPWTVKTLNTWKQYFKVAIE